MKQNSFGEGIRQSDGGFGYGHGESDGYGYDDESGNGWGCSTGRKE